MLWLRERVVEAMQSWESSFFAKTSAWSIELCTKTYDEAKKQATAFDAGSAADFLPMLPTQLDPATDGEPLATIGGKDTEIKPLRLHVHAYFYFGKRVHVRNSGRSYFWGRALCRVR